ncbi:glycoside hydrolase family 3 protein [Alteromonas facilis]|uniref:glycoside hydrolase family 3 protein n=1 Tax=Alteromonas facilis TaxID=2048004 RepID=UPI000C29425D|nr:glycoside hydrolase family 3 protein [Alteromonas facilis]
MNNLHQFRRQATALVKQLTLEQKVGQMTLADQSTCTPDDVMKYKLGGVMSSAGSCPEPNTLHSWQAMIDDFWDAALAIDESVQIPLLYGLDAIHGNANVQGATIFPHNIGIGAAHSEDAIRELAAITADEVRAIGANWIFGPNLAMAQHYHWGRMYESVAGDPDTVSQFARLYMEALNAEREDYPILACAKHFVGDGGTAYGIEQGDMSASFEGLCEHIKPFKAAVDSGVLCVMVAFSSWNGVKCHGNEFLITQQLKNALGFGGFVLSDMQGINYVDDDLYKAIGRSVNAGIDMFMVPQNWRVFQEMLTKHIELGSISINRIDDAVTRIVMAKYARGLFASSRPSDRAKKYAVSFGSVEHRAAARRIAADSCVLLKNDKQILPLSPHQRVLVTGKGATHTGMQCGGFTIDWQGVDEPDGIAGATTIWQGISKHTVNGSMVPVEEVALADPSAFDVAIVVVGERPYAEGLGDVRVNDQVLFESSSRIDGNLSIQPPYGRSLSLSELHPEVKVIIEQLNAKKIPMVCVLLSGRPLVIEPEFGLVDAFVAAWLPGSEGDAIAQVLFGERAFAGRLPFAWPASENQHALPLINAHMLYRQAWPAGHHIAMVNKQPQSQDPHENIGVHQHK